MPSADGGAHHVGIIGNVVYVPASDGTVFVVAPTKAGFKFLKPIKAGGGAGHVYYNPKSSVEVIATIPQSLSLFSTKPNIRPSQTPPSHSTPLPKKKSQAHTLTISLNGKYFYGAASQDGEFYRIDLAKKKKDKVLDLNTYGAGAQPLQGVIF